MSKKSPQNISASVHQKLSDKARSDGRPFNELLQYYAMERFLYRFSQSLHREKFVLKGALMLRVWDAPLIRPTMDIDFLGLTNNEVEEVRNLLQEICSVSVEPDGLVFDAKSFKGEVITEDADYEGVRVLFIGHLGSARINMQIDVAFGDVVSPEPGEVDLPAILDFPSPRLIGYSRESTISEKLEAMVKLGELNSRMKDFYDIWLLARMYDFKGGQLLDAVSKTFKQRRTAIPDSIVAFGNDFINTKAIQWKAFRDKLDMDSVPKDFADIVLTIRTFLNPIISVARSNKGFSDSWKAPGPWTSMTSDNLDNSIEI